MQICRNYFAYLQIAIALVLVGCTVTPKAIRIGAPSWDGSQQNSGLLGQLDDRSGVITAHGRDRYNALVDVYGSKFVPTVTRDAGVTAFTNGTWRIDPEHLVKFATMNRWRKQSASGP